MPEARGIVRAAALHQRAGFGPGADQIQLPQEVEPSSRSAAKPGSCWPA
jgi:hypothetical protein